MALGIRRALCPGADDTDRASACSLVGSSLRTTDCRLQFLTKLSGLTACIGPKTPDWHNPVGSRACATTLYRGDLEGGDLWSALPRYRSRFGHVCGGVSERRLARCPDRRRHQRRDVLVGTCARCYVLRADSDRGLWQIASLWWRRYSDSIPMIRRLPLPFS